ncbi:acyltransferase [Candidatus Viridilinea mediisalina]|uniref:N-acetyltransferase n=1 Tax=Candidatus Viridilinea mediisalina TaxID=2024553 RepID=A0A2A6RG21_9CHLR|nr:acyltransferase [Candidatus Viridilinea mediisalina]PDW01836.1 N-acetyltransferase [Candidatus Viridilinea mediisalina]
MATIHPTADVSPLAVIGAGTRVWSYVQIRERARIGVDCIIGRNCYIDLDVSIGDRVKIQNNASLYLGLSVEDGVFIGPHVVFTNDKVPRAINPDGTLKQTSDWQVGQTRVCYGAAIGAHSVIVTGITIGRWAMVGAGSTVTKDVPDYGLVLGNPARLIGWVNARGERCASQAEARALPTF